MTVALWDVAEVTAVADAIRAKKGTSNTMKVSEMPAEIASIPSGSPEEWRECWIEKPRLAANSLFIDTGVLADFNHKLVYQCRSSAAMMSAPFNSCASSGPRYGMNFLPRSNKVQVYWGSYANTGLTITRDSLDVVQPLTVTQDRTGVTVEGLSADGTLNIRTWTQEYSATAASGTQENYKLFTYARNTDIHFGLFRRAEIQNASSETIATIVPEVNNNFVARLKITEGENVRYVPIPQGFICHVDNVASS